MIEGTVAVQLLGDEERVIRYVSGSAVYEEAFAEGRLAARYRSAGGQIMPEAHLKRENDAGSGIPQNVFGLSIAQAELSDGWTWVSAGLCEDTSKLGNPYGKAQAFAVRLRHDTHPVEVCVHTRLDGSPFLVRWLDITNMGAEPLAIAALYPLAGAVFRHGPWFRQDEILTYDAENPLYIAYDHRQTWWTEADFYFDPVKPGLFHYGCRNGKSGHARPAFWLRDRQNGETFVCEFAWSGNWDFDIYSSHKSASWQAAIAIGMGPMDGEMHRVLLPGETVHSPAVHAGLFHCTDEMITQALHKHIRDTVLPPAPGGRVCEVEANHRGYLSDREDEPSLLADVDVAAAVGAEMYVIDAGWFGKRPNHWFDNTGDWFAGEWLPNDLTSVVHLAHGLGMKFGLWAEIEAAGKNSILRQEHPEWLLRRDDVPVADGRALDLANPQVAQWIQGEISRMIRQYGLDMFRIDHNHNIGLGGNRAYCGYTENLLWRYYENLYEVFDYVRKSFPDVVLQNCAGGGGRLDLGIMSRFHNTELSDCLRQPRELRIFNNMTMALPPEILLNTFGMEAVEPSMQGGVDLAMRLSIISRPIFRGIAPSKQELNPDLKERIKHHLKLFKEFLRPLMINCNVFHHTPMLPIMKSSPWVVLEYVAKDKSRAMAALFQTTPDADLFRLYPKGLDRSGTYIVRFDNSGESIESSGHLLMNDGLRIAPGCQFLSELVTFTMHQ